MLHQSTLAAAAVLLAASADASSLYAKNSPVLQVTGRSYDRLIAQSNHTSVRRCRHRARH
jgi:protein disulfide-isomerase A6